jgi:acyl carrier protein
MREWLRGDEAEVIFELRLGASEFVRDMLGTPSSDARDASSPVVVRLRTCTVEQRPGLLSQYLAELLAAATRVASADSIDKRLGFLDMGVDSLTTVELTSRIQRDLDVALEPTAAFNYPTIEKLTAHVLDRLFPAAHVGRAPSRLATLPESDVVERIEALSEEEANEMVAGMEPLG